MQVLLENLPQYLKENKKRLNSKDALHYCPPCGGGWGVVKTAVQVPEVQVLFVIPIGCGRHGAIAAMKDGTDSRIHYLLMEEVDLVSGDHLEKTEAAVRELVEETEAKGLILFTTCIDDLLGSDFEGLIEKMEEELQIPISRGKMNPILSETPRAPDIMVHNTAYNFLRERGQEESAVNLVGCLSPVTSDSELFDFLESGGIREVRHMGNCSNFDEFLSMADSRVNLLIRAPGKRACRDMERAIGLPWIDLPASFLPEKIDEGYKNLSLLGDFSYDTGALKREAEEAIREIRPLTAGRTAVLGKTVNADSFDLALFLHRLGFQLKYVLAAAVKDHEQEAMEILRTKRPDLPVIPHLDPALALRQENSEEVDFGFGLDTAVYFRPRKLVLLPFETSLFGYRGILALLESIRSAEPFSGSVKDLVYNANLVI
ncbi:MAG: nitrogenase component 1 [Spirochaetales bacterium]|nr:nitrogenase component 1 [Spirochaetales bacterium]